MKLYLGVDVGSVSTNLVLVNSDGELVRKLYLRSLGNPVGSVQQGLQQLTRNLREIEIAGVGVTGSGRMLIGKLLGADLVKNEITAHAVAGLTVVPNLRTIIEIGGQDSKLIMIRDGVVSDFAMNTVCAAGTGSFLDQQAARLNLDIAELGNIAARGSKPVRIAGRCAVFAESDMIHKQQMGHPLEDILAGLCQALARNFLTNLAKGKELAAPVIFQGGVAANHGIRRAFEEALQCRLVIPEHFDVMGAFGAAYLVKDEMALRKERTDFRGFAVLGDTIATSSMECNDCANQCEVIELRQNGGLLACLGDKCGKWSAKADESLASSHSRVG